MSSDEPMDQTLRIVLIVVAALVLAPAILMVFAVPLMGMGMGMWGGGLMGGQGGYGMAPIWGLLWPLIWLVVLIGGGYLAYKWLTGDARGDPALRELRLAYAQGEISDEEFEERRARLTEE